MKRKVVERKIKPEKAFHVIFSYAKYTNSWVFISSELMERLTKMYDNQPYPKSRREGTTFEIDGWYMEVDFFDGNWSRVWMLSKKDETMFTNESTFILSEPELIVFLS